MAPKRRASAKLKNIHVDYSLRRNSQELTDLNATDMDDPDERDIEAEVQKSAARGKSTGHMQLNIGLAACLSWGVHWLL